MEVEIFPNLNAGHEAVEASGDRRPLCVLFADSLFSVDFEIDLLIFSKLGNENVLVDELRFDLFGSLVTLRHPLQLIRVN